MAFLDKISTRYAKAIFEFLKSEVKTRLVIQAFGALKETLETNPDLKKALTTKLFGINERRGILEDLNEKMDFSDEAKRVILLLSEQGRLSHLSQIAERLHQLLLESANVLPLHIATAMELSNDEKNKVEVKFKKILGKEVEATYQLDPDLYGGLKVKTSGRTFDGTLSGWLMSLEEKLIGGSL